MKTNLIIIYATILQFIVGVFILISPKPILITSLGIFYNLFPTYQVGAILMLLAVTVTIVGIFIPENRIFRFLFFMPQHFFLILTSGSSLFYIVQGHYADGVHRGWEFIFIDQLPMLLLTLLYVPAIIDFKKKTHA